MKKHLEVHSESGELHDENEFQHDKYLPVLHS